MHFQVAIYGRKGKRIGWNLWETNSNIGDKERIPVFIANHMRWTACESIPVHFQLVLSSTDFRKKSGRGRKINHIV